MEADFSGDNTTDLAILIQRKNDGKKGVLILFRENDKSFVLGAGNGLGNAGDDFGWAGSWEVTAEPTTYETTFSANGDVEDGKEVTLERPAISIREAEGSGGLIYFNGKRFVWIHQGD